MHIPGPRSTIRLVSYWTAAICAVAAGVLWIRSYRRIDQISYKRDLPFQETSEYWVQSWAGIAEFDVNEVIHVTESQVKLVDRGSSPPPTGEWRRMVMPMMSRDATAWRYLGFAVTRQRVNLVFPENRHELYINDDVAVPYWSLVVTMGMPPLYSAAKWWRARRRAKRPGVFCQKCGYDLRASPTRCPECGWHPNPESR